MKKLILDACCGSRMFWFDKNNPHTLFADRRSEDCVLCDGRKLCISPDIRIDFKNMPFSDSSFSLVVFDPPHLIDGGEGSWMVKKYGVLPKNWQQEIKQGFDECMRVLKPEGTLIFKWNETQIKVSKIIEAIDYSPLFGHKSGKRQGTHWLCFMKIGSV